MNGAVIAQGVAGRIGIHPSTFYGWQQQHKEFGESIARARIESAHRIADRMLALADAALAAPALANAVRVAGDILKWQAQVRNPGIYGERSRIDINMPLDLGERLLRAQARVIKHEAVPTTDPVRLPEQESGKAF